MGAMQFVVHDAFDTTWCFCGPYSWWFTPMTTVMSGPFAGEQGSAEAGSFDTSSLNVMDGDGNLFSMTESDGHLSTPMIPGWGFGLGARMEQFNLDPALANVMAPGKRPRNTNSPLIVMKGGQPFMGLSTPGGDQQMQALLQVILNVIVWEMAPEQAERLLHTCWHVAMYEPYLELAERLIEAPVALVDEGHAADLDVVFR